jgi:hypothetical protein
MGIWSLLLSGAQKPGRGAGRGSARRPLRTDLLLQVTSAKMSIDASEAPTIYGEGASS